MSQDGRSAPVRPHTPLLPQLDAKTLDEIRRHARPRRYAAGDVICREVARTDSVLILQRGSADVYVTSSVEMRTATVGHLRAGDIVGEVGALTGLPRSATVVASSRACALEIKRRDFDRLLAGHPWWSSSSTRNSPTSPTGCSRLRVAQPRGRRPSSIFAARVTQSPAPPAQVDASARQAARADVTLTPQSGPGTWRDMHLGSLFFAAGAEAAEAQLSRLRSLARPCPASMEAPPLGA